MHRAWASACIGLLGCGRVAFDPRGDASADSKQAIAECAADPRLIACYDFEGDAGDRSNHGNDANGIQVTYVAGRFGRGIQMDESSRADLAMPALATTQWTFDAWIRPDLPPAGSLELVFDHEARWAIMVEDQAGTLVFGCNSALTQGFVSRPLVPGTWAHVACIDDGVTSVGYLDGLVETVGTGNGGGTSTVAAIGGNAPLLDTLSPFLGTIDRLRIWNVALPPAELDAID